MTSAIGLKTHIWNNAIKSALFLALYPLLITATYMAVIGTVLFYFAFNPDFHPGTHYTPETFIALFRRIVVDYWYVPYALIGMAILIIYLLHLNRIDIGAGMTPVSRQSQPSLYALLENLCISRGFKMPYFFIWRNDAINAYSTGMSPGTYTIVVTSKLIEELTEEEIECVLAHELTHLINEDTRLLFLTGTVSHIFGAMAALLVPRFRLRRRSRAPAAFDHAGVNRGSGTDPFSFGNSSGGFLVFWFSLKIIFKLANIGSLFARLFVSQRREFIADAGAIELTKNPQAMISALRKVKRQAMRTDIDESLRPLLLHYDHAGMGVASHPSIDVRIAVLEKVSRMRAEHTEPPSPWARKTIAQAKKEVVW